MGCGCFSLPTAVTSQACTSTFCSILCSPCCWLCYLILWYIPGFVFHFNLKLVGLQLPMVCIWQQWRPAIYILQYIYCCSLTSLPNPSSLLWGFWDFYGSCKAPKVREKECFFCLCLYWNIANVSHKFFVFFYYCRMWNNREESARPKWKANIRISSLMKACCNMYASLFVQTCRCAYRERRGNKPPKVTSGWLKKSSGMQLLVYWGWKWTRSATGWP